MPVAAIDTPSSYSFYAKDVWGPPQDIMYDYFDALGRLGARSNDGGDGAVRASGADVQRAAPPARRRSSRTPASSAAALPAGYPTSEDHFPGRMASVAQLLGAGLPLRCVSVSTESVFDTHDNQAEDFNKGLDGAAQTLLAFQRDLEARGLADRVLTLVWSEFGRRPQENASGGTDHGAAGARS